MDHKKLRLFEIIEVKGLVNYRLKLLKTIWIHLVFYISLLEKVLLGALLVDIVCTYNTMVKVKELKALHEELSSDIKFIVV